MSIKIDIISGFLGAGKTTLIRRLLENGFNNEKLVLIENEFGEIGIDGSFLKEAGVNIKEINSGCICCSLVGDFSKSMKEVIEKFQPERVIIEPSGVGKLSDIVEAIEKLDLDLKLNIVATVVDGSKCKIYMKNFGEFFNNQVEDAKTIIVTKTERLDDAKREEVHQLLKEKNNHANIVFVSLPTADANKLFETLEKTGLIVSELEKELKHEHHHEHEEGCCCEHEHHHEHEEGCCCEHENHHEHEEGCCCEHEHHHEHEEGCCCEHEHHHEHEEGCCCEHEHHHEHEEGCCCDHEHHHEHEEGCCCEHENHHEHEEGCCCEHDHEHHHHHHHGHDADEVFVSYGFETTSSYSKDELSSILEAFKDENECGVVLRAKGILRASDDSNWYYFDYVAGDYQINLGSADFMGRFVVIGSNLNKERIEKLVLKK